MFIPLQIERIKFREIVNNEQKSPENTLDKITNKMQAILGLIQGNKKSDMVFNRSAMIRQINHNMNMIDNTMGALDYMLGKIQKFNVEIKKTQRILGKLFNRADYNNDYVKRYFTPGT